MTAFKRSDCWLTRTTNACLAKPALGHKDHFPQHKKQQMQHQVPLKRPILVTFSGIDSAQILAKTAKTATGKQTMHVFCEHSKGCFIYHKTLIIKQLIKYFKRKIYRNTHFFYAQLSQFPSKTARTFVSTSNMLHF